MAGSKADLERMGFSRAQRDRLLLGGLLIPTYNVLGECTGAVYRLPDRERKARGIERRFEFPKGLGAVVDVLPDVRDSDEYRDESLPMLICEGQTRADAAWEHLGLPTVSISGCWGWRGRGDSGGISLPVDDLAELPLKGRDVVVAFDGDLSTNASVQRAAVEFVGALKRRGAKSVAFLAIDEAQFGQSAGLDDVIANWVGEGLDWESMLQRFEGIVRPAGETVDGDMKRLSHLRGAAQSFVLPGLVRRGCLTLLEAWGEAGKSTYALALCSGVSSGGTFPTAVRRESGELGVDQVPLQEGPAIFVSEEMDEAQVWKVARKFGATDSFYHYAPSGPMDFGSNFAELESRIRRVRPVIVVVDPITAYLGDRVNGHQESQVRNALRPVIALASELGFALVGIRHWRKDVGGALQDPGGGSGAYRNLARSTIQAIRQDGRTYFCHDKANETSRMPTLAVEIGSTPVEGSDDFDLVWKVIGPDPRSALDLKREAALAARADGQAERATKGSQVTGFIAGALEPEGWVEAKSLVESIDARGLAEESTVRRAVQKAPDLIWVTSGGRGNPALIVDARRLTDLPKPVRKRIETERKRARRKGPTTASSAKF